MGTHGYGDITPKGILARLYAVVWILIGIVNLGILTGALTTAMTVSQVYDSSMIYDVEIAAVQDSEAYKIGLNRNGKMNKKNKYKTIEEVSSALKRREVRGALVDVYSAAMRSDLFDHPDIVAKKKIVYPNAYGLVFAGELKNAASAFRDYLNVNAKVFLDGMQKKAAGLQVQKESGETVSPFDPKSKTLHRTFTILFVIFSISFLCGLLFNVYRSNRKKRVVSAEGPYQELKHLERSSEDILDGFETSSRKKLDTLLDFHLKERVVMIKKMRKTGSLSEERLETKQEMENNDMTNRVGNQQNEPKCLLADVDEVQ
ncbi:uncharacterized protein LOC135688464 [Rhopilema esculentum]|uniref:uncharacterized protein LOC135688464 n=1 Tax=Rhopilema esculentum TaxID=499914 RepID=UPI0031D1917E